ncbi:MAG: hypothetical protein ABIF19_01945 [Planctomycetota bacterium]
MQEAVSAKGILAKLWGRWKVGWDVNMPFEQFAGETCWAVAARKTNRLLPPIDMERSSREA